MSVKNTKSKLWKIAIIVLVLIALAVIGYGVYYLLNPVHTITGRVVDSDNSKPVKGLKVQAGKQESITQANGTYELKNVKKNTAIVYSVPSIYKETNPKINYDESKKVDLHTKKITKDILLDITESEKIVRVKAFEEKLHNDFKFARYENLYDAMHSDSQKQISKSDYINRAKKDLESVTLTDTKVGNVTFLDTWHFEELNKDYKNVAEIEDSYTIQFLGINQTINQLTHAVKENGQWKWFYANN